MSRAELLLNWFLQWWFAGNFPVSFHKCHINSSCRSKSKPPLSSRLWHPVSDDLGCVRMRLCTTQLCEMWTCPIDELQSVLLWILLKNVNWTRGEGEMLIRPPLSWGHRWPRHVCGSVKVRELLSCQSTKIDEIQEVPRKELAWHQGH